MFSSTSTSDSSSMPIAIIGIGVRFPGDGSDPEHFWKMMCEAQSARSEVPKSRYNIDGFWHPDTERLGVINSKHAHFLKQDFKVFDAPFFAITPKEAKAMDPGHRMLLEVTYEGFENAGLRLDDVKGTKTSCYIGTFTGDFEGVMTRDNKGPSMYHATGMSSSLASNRLSWFYDLKGPSMTVDTACSSSLTAFHLACQSIRTGEAEMSVVGGSNLMFGPDMSVLLGAAKILSPDGKSQMWDEKANGFSRGEGIGITVLKPLDAALRDGNTIRAVVLASAVNQDGRTPGISLPSSDAQQELIRTAYQQAGVDPAETGYVEAHGTGTAAGDPLEASAIIGSFASNRKSDLYVGSVKTSIGHLEGAAGIAGVIKAALVVERGLIPQNLWFDKLNPQISLPTHVKVPQQLCQWPSDGPRRASINSFGFGGANAHVVVEDAAHYLQRHGLEGNYNTGLLRSQLALTNGYHKDEDTAEETPKLFVISSSDRDGVKRNIQQLRTYLEEGKKLKNPTFIDSLAYTLGEKRTALPWKSFAIASDMEGLLKSLDDAPAAIRSSEIAISKVAFVFTGQGAQWFAMGKGLTAFDVYKESLLSSEKLLKTLGSSWTLSEELNRSESESRLNEAEFSQPICTALQIALVDLLRHWDVSPAAVVGHSSGEIAAAYCAGIISRDAAIEIAWLRGQFAKKVASANLKGAMLAVSAAAESIQSHLAALTKGKAVAGCLNSPKSCTVSGDKAAVDELCQILTQQQISFQRLKIEVAYHSPHMQTIKDAYGNALSNIGSPRSSTIPMFSSVTGSLVGPKELGASYWVANLVSPVNFDGAVRALLNHTKDKKRLFERKASVFAEIGPHSALRSYLLDIVKSEDNKASPAYATVLRRGHGGLQTALKFMGDLYTNGCQLSLSKINNTAKNIKMLVDLPPYAWNHTTSFWEESYLSKEYRLRESPRLDLLGFASPGVPNPEWRNYLRVSENPWIREHRVQGNIIYPGAGLMIMAIEGARQTAVSNETIIGYELRDVQIVDALRLPDDDTGVEICVQFHPRRTGTKDAPSTSLKEFAISSWSDDNDQWQTHCRGLISLTYESQVSDSMQRELKLDDQKYKDTFKAAQEKCQKPARNFIYDKVEEIGMSYGETFRNITNLYAGDGASWGTLTIPDTKATMPSMFEYSYVIHPATLDSVLHLLFPSISGTDQSLAEAVVPIAIDRLFISASIPTTCGTELYGCSTAQKTSFTTWTSSISVSTEEWEAPLIIMEGLRLASLGATESATSETRAQCFETIWHEDIDLISQDRVKELVYQRTLSNEDDDTVLDHLEFICLVHIRHILRWFETEGKTHIPSSGFFQLYYEWMQEQMTQFPPLDTDDAKVNRQLELSKRKIVGSKSGEITVEMVDRIGQNLERIFSKEIEPLQVMLEGDLLYTFYRGAFGTCFNTNVAEYVGMIADKKPGLSILEIGAGTGGTTYHVLERLRNEDGSSKAQNYTFTDISPGFLAKAAERFSTDASVMDFKTLNIEEDPEKLGFQPESYDILVCANVLHATKSISETLAHCYSLLKPGGKLVLSEVTIKRIFSGFIMGPLPGWWLGEDDGRKGGPLMDAEEWDTALKKANFSGVDMDVRGDSEESQEPVSLLVSTKPIVSVSKPASEFVVIGNGNCVTTQLSSAIQAAFEAQGKAAIIVPWGSVTSLEDKYVICLAEWEEPILARLSDEDWETFRHTVHSAKGVLWVTGGASSLDCSHPLGSLIVGLSRAIRNENANLSLATIDIETPKTVNLLAASNTIVEVAISHSRGESTDHEYAARNGLVFVPRATKSPKLQKNLLKYESKGEVEQVLFKDAKRPLKLSIKMPGLLDTFQFEDDTTYYTALQEDWVEIEVKAVGLNFKDVLVAMGHLNENKLGVDVSGVVTRVGSSVTSFKVGDRVMTSSCNTFASFVRFPAAGGIPMPEDMTFEEGASMPLIYLTAHYALMTIGRMVAGESILIHAAAGGVGQAAIVVAQNVGAEIFATVGSDEKKALIMAEYGIAEDHIFNSRDLSFAKGIMRSTCGKGVDVVLNSLAGEALRLSWHCLAKFGRFLEIGKADLFVNTGLDMQPFLENKIYAGVNLIDFENNPTPRAVALFKEVAQLIKNDKFKPVKPIQLFTFSEIEKAFRYMQTGKHSGKIVVKVDDKDIVTAVPATPTVQIKENATYVLAGGLGGICREIGRWLAEKGATNLVFLSRSASEGEANIAFIESLRSTYGTNAIAYNCDVADKASLGAALEKCKSLPPIRGLVTGAMVLRDTLFDEMTAAHVRTTVGPKVHGTWNLHEMLPKDMDFFVMLSSLAGVMGHRGQGNYGAGNIFQDYFASFRRSQGLPAMTIDISYLLSVGFVAENDQYVDHIKSMGLKCMTNSDLHGLMATAMEGTQAHPGQVMIGLPSAEFQESWYWIQDGKFASLLNRAQGSNLSNGSTISLSEELLKASDMAAATDLISEAIVQKLARLMMVPESDIDPEKPLSTYGVDSLVAVEVRNWMAKEILVDVSVFEITANIPIKQLASNLGNKSKLLKKE